MFRFRSSIIPRGQRTALSVTRLPKPLLRPSCQKALLSPPFTRPLVTSGSCMSHMITPESLSMNLDREVFNYTAGWFLANESYRLRKRRRVFNLSGLFNAIASAINCKTDQIIGFRKLGEGGLNRVFLITLDNKSQLVARIPYPLVDAKAHAIASEVATMRFLRSKGLPIPEVYVYSYTSDNEAGTEYILMEYVKGTDLSEVWFDLKENEIESVMRQLVEVESIMMSVEFPAGGSIYYTKDLKELSGKEGIPIDDQFSMGPDLSSAIWYGRREQLDVFRGPYKDAKSVLLAGAQKEIAYLQTFGLPRAPYDRSRREDYKYQKQLPSDHIKNLSLYLRVAPWLVPNDDSLRTFRIRHPDLSTSNIMVSADSGSLKIVSVLDWQYADVLPIFLNAGVPVFLQTGDDMDFSTFVKPTLPGNFEELPEAEKNRERDLLRRRLVYFYYASGTAAHNKIHHKGLMYPLNSFTRRIYIHATNAWFGETVQLLCDLMELTDGTPCPVAFTEEEISGVVELHSALEEADSSWTMMRRYVGCGSDTWIPAADYEKCKARGEELKKRMFSIEDSESCEEEAANWPLDDMSEEELEEYK